MHFGVSDSIELDVASSLAFSTTPGSGTRHDFGDTTFGVKYRLVDEADGIPLVSLVPKVTLPTGDATRGLGNGRTRALLGIAAQKQRGSWQAYANIAYAIDNGSSNRNFWFRRRESAAEPLSAMDPRCRARASTSVAIVFSMNATKRSFRLAAD